MLGSLRTLGQDCKTQVSTALNTAESLYYQELLRLEGVNCVEASKF